MSDEPPASSPASAAGPVPSVEQALSGLSMPLVEVLTTQRSIRRLRPDPVDDTLVLRCIELALKAPTGSNSQNWEFVVVRDRGVKEQLAARYREAWKVYGAAARRAAASNPAQAKVVDAVAWQVEHFAEVPVLVVACLRGGLRGAHVPFVPLPPIARSAFYGSIFPSVQNLLLAARAMDLGASLVTLPLWSQLTAQRILGLPLAVVPVCVVALGWPRGRYGPTTRRPVGEVVHLDRYGHRPWLAPADADA